MTLALRHAAADGHFNYVFETHQYGKLPELVRQEVWGMQIACNLLRHEIAQMASELQVPP